MAGSAGQSLLPVILCFLRIGTENRMRVLRWLFSRWKKIVFHNNSIGKKSFPKRGNKTRLEAVRFPVRPPASHILTNFPRSPFLRINFPTCPLGSRFVASEGCLLRYFNDIRTPKLPPHGGHRIQQSFDHIDNLLSIEMVPKPLYRILTAANLSASFAARNARDYLSEKPRTDQSPDHIHDPAPMIRQTPIPRDTGLASRLLCFWHDLSG